MTTLTHETSTQTDLLDVLIVGGGFSGLYALDQLRDRGFSVKVWDAAGDFGGIWWWNCYPGARTDSTGQVYQFSHKDLWKEFDFAELFPSHEGVREYLNYVDQKLDLRKDVTFDTFVDRAAWDENSHTWTVTSTDGKAQRAKTVIVATGFGSKPLYPDIPGLDSFAGECHHTARWPQAGVELTGKKVVVLGTGASGVQVIQEAAPVAEHLTVFQRTPNLALPMRQKQLTPDDNEEFRKDLPRRFEVRARAFAGFDFDFMAVMGADLSPAELRAEYDKLWEHGGFELWLGTLGDMLADEKVNRTFYDYWRSKVHERVADPAKAELLAPALPPHPFGVKRPALEQNYFDVINGENVDLIDHNEEPILEVVPEGVRTKNGLIEADVLVLATGFDNNRGGILAIDLEGVGGVKLQDKWAGKVETNFGLSTAEFPNLLFLYGPQSPSGFCNGPTSAEEQGKIVVEFLEHVRDCGLTRFENTRESELQWTQHLDELFEASMFTKAKSWYWGANVPGKPAQMLNYCGGLQGYFDQWVADKELEYGNYTFA
ncbi:MULTISPECIES: flavin-containing monooxygenase [unclassified Aeromicrobium]|uniref:flavin-containing monooxygenase n=1 Tax=unclassified Aeromicrobium TaxID=2633570 RepID=UPI00396B26DE